MRLATTKSMKGMAWSRIKWVRMVFVLLVFALIVPTGGCPVLWSYSIEGITCLSVSESGNYVAVGCQDGWYYIFDTWGNRVGSGHVQDAVVSLDIADTGDLIVGFSDEYTFCTVEGVQLSSVGYGDVRDVSISSDGKSSLACSRKNVLINLGTSMVLELEVSSDSPFGVISSDGTVACAASDTDLIVFEIFEDDIDWWSHEVGKEIKHLFVSADGEKIIFSTTNTIRYLDTETKELKSIDTDSVVLGMAATPTGDVTVVATENELIWLKGKSIMSRLDGDGQIHVLSLVDDSLAVTGKDNTIQVITSDGTLLFTYEVESPVKALEICQDLLVVCTENSIYTFQLFQKVYTSTNFIPTASRKSLPLTSPIEEVWSIPIAKNSYFFTADIDADGFTEILLKEGTKLILLDGNGNVESVRDIGRKFGVEYLLDVDGDTTLEIPLISASTKFRFSVYDWKDDSTRNYYLDPLNKGIPFHDAQVTPRAVIDSNGDGNLEMLAAVGVGYSCKPRGMASIDYESGEIIWFCQRGTGPMSMTVQDINGDGSVEIVLGSMAPCTCPDDEEYPDCDVYVTALSITGEELWEVPMGHGFRRIAVSAADVDESKGIEIIEFGYNASENWGNITVLNCHGEYLYTHEFDYSIIPGAIGDIDGDGTKEIVIADTRGYLTMYTGDLQVKSIKFITDDINTQARLHLNDFDGDGFLEIFLALERELFIFDKDLNVLWKEEFPDFVRLEIVNFFQCKNTILVLSDKLYAFEYKTGDSPCPLWEITERTLTEEGTYYKNEAASAFAAGEYRISKFHYESALDRFEKLENQEMVDYLSERIKEISTIISKQNVKIGMIFLAVCDGGLLIFLLSYWIFRRLWSRLGEGALLLSLPVLLGLFQVHSAHEEYLQVFVRYAVPSLIGSVALVFRQNILGFARTIAAILSGHKGMLVLSIVKADHSYRVSIESIEERFSPVKESRKVTFSEQTKKDLIRKVEYMMDVLGQVPSRDHTSDYVEGILRETGAEIYQNVIPKDFSDILKTKFLFLEVEDTEIPWELMYSDNFFALTYAVSRRIVSPDPVHIREKRTRKRRALIISDPLENLPDAKTECEIVSKRLKQKMDTVFVEGHNASVRRVVNLFGQGFDIIHYAGHVDNGFVLSDGVITPEEVREFIVGKPVVFVNGCKSEELAEAFLLGGAMAYVGTLHPVHDTSAAGIAADFYDFCLQYRIGEALRRAREYHVNDGVIWASLVMYGDPTLKLL